MDQLLNPQFIAELAVLITAITGLIVALQNKSKVGAVAQDVAQVKDKTNGTLDSALSQLKAVQSRVPGHSRVGDPPPPTSPPAPPAA